MDTDTSRLKHQKETQKILGCAMDVINGLGHGFHEKPYENALVVEFSDRGIPFHQQKVFDILYKDREIGKYIPDLIAFDSVVIDTKVIERIGRHEIGQMMNYLKISGLDVGLILNFKNPKLERKRVVR